MPGTPIHEQQPARRNYMLMLKRFSTDDLLDEIERRGDIDAELCEAIQAGDVTCLDDLRFGHASDIEPAADDFERFGPIQDATAELRGGRREEACRQLERALPREWIGALTHA